MKILSKTGTCKMIETNQTTTFCANIKIKKNKGLYYFTILLYVRT